MPTTTRFTKLDATGQALPADATDHVQVLDNTTGLIWTVENIGRKAVPQAKAEKLASACRIGDHDDWSLPSAEQLLTLVDRTRVSPAIDVDAFPGTKSDWYWTSTPYAGSPAEYAWVVRFDSGSAGYGHRGSRGFVRAVRSVRAPSQ